MRFARVLLYVQEFVDERWGFKALTDKEEDRYHVPHLMPEERGTVEVECVDCWLMVGVEAFDIGMEHSTFEILDLFAGIDFAEVAEVVETDESLGCGAHGGDVEVALFGLRC